MEKLIIGSRKIFKIIDKEVYIIINTILREKAEAQETKEIEQ